MKKDLSQLSFKAAEELQKLKEKKENDLTSTKELSKLLKIDFLKNENYTNLFQKAYFKTYSRDIQPNENAVQMIYFAKKLEYSNYLKSNELEDLVKFCSNLSDFSSEKIN